MFKARRGGQIRVSAVDYSSPRFFREFRTGALCDGTISCPFPRPQGASRQTCFCVKVGAGPPVWKFPVKSCDRLPGCATLKDRVSESGHVSGILERHQEHPALLRC